MLCVCGWLAGELISTLRGHTKGIWACAFYPIGHTSALLASGGEDCTARLWDTRSRKVALTLSGGHADAIYSISWSNSGTHIVTGSSDNAVTVWDPKVRASVVFCHDVHQKVVQLWHNNSESALLSAGPLIACCLAGVYLPAGGENLAHLERPYRHSQERSLLSGYPGMLRRQARVI